MHDTEDVTTNRSQNESNVSIQISTPSTIASKTTTPTSKITKSK